MKRNFFSHYFLVALGLAGGLSLAMPSATKAATLGGTATFDKVLSENINNPNVFTDLTTQAASANFSDVPMTGMSNIILYFGMKSPFDAVYFDVGSWGTGTGQIRYEYYSFIDQWDTLFLTENPSNNFMTASGDGKTYIKFTPPETWLPSTVNGVEAYWMRMTIMAPFFDYARATQIKADAYNAFVKFTLDSGNVSGNLNPSATYGPDCALSGVIPSRDPIGYDDRVYYALPTSGNCTMQFNNLNPAGFVNTSYYVGGLSTTMQDLTSLPKALSHFGRVYVTNDRGSDVSDAATVVKLGNDDFSAKDGAFYFFSAAVAERPLTIRLAGYVTEGTASGINSALVNVSDNDPSTQTFIRLQQGNTPCTGSIASGTLTSCAALTSNTKFTVNKADGALSGASLSVYTDAGMTQVANDIGTAGAADAVASSNSSGQAIFALADGGTFYYRVSANGYQTATGNFTIIDGVLNQKTVTMVAQQQQPDNSVSASQTMVNAAPLSVAADGVSTATVTVTAKNAAGQTLSGKVVTLNSTLGAAVVSPASANTNNSGVATFTVKSGTVGASTITATVDGIAVAQAASVQFIAQQADTSVSASQSTITFSPSNQSVSADNSSLLTMTVTAKNAAGAVLANKAVTLAGDFTGITVSPVSGTTDATGKAIFTLKSGTVKNAAITVTAGGAVLSSIPTVAFSSTSIDQTVSASTSFVGASPASVTANGVQAAIVTVIVRNPSSVALSGKQVFLSSSFGAAVISPAFGITDSAGVATFSVISSSVGTAQFTATVSNVAFNTKPTVQFVAAPAPVPTLICQNPLVAIGSLIKLQDDGNPATQEDSAVYYYGKDCKRHAFANDKVYFTWYTDFNGVVTVGLQTLAAMPLGKNVTYRPGAKMVKFTTLNNVYAVGKGGVLRWVKTEAVAIALYGTNWNKKIDDISDAFFINYVFGADINSTSDYSVNGELSGAPTIDDNL